MQHKNGFLGNKNNKDYKLIKKIIFAFFKNNDKGKKIELTL